MPKPTYDTSLARMAGNIASGIISAFVRNGAATKDAELISNLDAARVAQSSVLIARAIIGELQTTKSEEGK